jgi:CheY-like chemotaxis protein
MKIIQESAEHHFLTALDRLKNDPGGWVGMHFALSRRLDHDDVIDVPGHIKGKLHQHRKVCEEFARDLFAAAAPFANLGTLIYLFTDGDIVLMAGPRNESDREKIVALFKSSAAADPRLATLSNLAKDIYNYQKLADQKFLAARRIAAYEAMADQLRTQSIPLRRERRNEGVVLLVEDDRFTASIAANILNKDYDLVHAKTGEEAIIAYIEHAPDIALLDIHLPGLSGHEVMRALKKIDEAVAAIMLSVDTVKTNIVDAAQGGALGFLKKPFARERLQAAVLKSPHMKGSKVRRPPPQG